MRVITQKNSKQSVLRGIVVGAVAISSFACGAPGGNKPRNGGDTPATEQREQSGLMRAMHVARGAPALALTRDGGITMVDGLAFGGTTDRLSMSPGAHGVDVFEAATKQPVASADDVDIADGARHALILWGSADDMRALFLTEQLGPGIRLFNLSARDASSGQPLRASLGGANTGALFAGRESSIVRSAQGNDDGTITVALERATEGGVESVTFTLPASTNADAERATDLLVVDNEGGQGTTLFVCSDNGLIEIPANEAVPPARLRAIHLSSNAPAVDVFVNGNAAVTGITYPSATAYLELAPSSPAIAVAPSGAGVDAAVIRADALPLLAGRDTSVVAYGNLPSIRALALEEDRSPVRAGSIRVRAAHTADGVGQVDVLAIASDAAQNVLIYDDVDYGQVSGYLEIVAEALTLGLDLDDDLQPEFVFDVPALPVGTVVTLFASLGADGPFLFAVADGLAAVLPGAPPAPPAPPANLRVVHLSPDAPAVAVNVNQTRAIETLSFFSGTAFLPLTAGATDIDVSLAASPDAPIVSLAAVEFAAGSFTTAVAYGPAANLAVLAIPEDFAAPAAGNTRVRAVHTAVGVGTVDVYVVAAAGNTRIVDDLAFGSYSDALEVPAGQYTIGLDVNNDTHVDLTFHLPALDAGAIANLYAVTDAHGNAHLAVQ